MCGIVAVVRRPSDRRAPELRDLLRVLDDADARLLPLIARPSVGGLNEVSSAIADVERVLRGASGTFALLADPVGLAALEHRGGVTDRQRRRDSMHSSTGPRPAKRSRR